MKITRYFLIITFCLTSLLCTAGHIVGGTTNYQVKNVNAVMADVNVVFNVYKDANTGADLDDNIDIGVYGFRNGNYTFLQSISTELIFTTIIQFEDEGNCPSELYPYILGVYSIDVNLPINNYDFYTISYQRCCRDNSLSNIVNPSESGIALTLDIYPSAFEHFEQIPILAKPFPRITEVGKNIQFDFGLDDMFDKEYSLSKPKVAGGVTGSSIPGDPNSCEGIVPSPLVCPPPYDEIQYLAPNNPYGTAAALDLGEDGMLDMYIPVISKVLIGVTVDRFFEGEKISTIRQQFVTNSISCDPLSSKDDLEDDVSVWPIPVTETIYFSTPLTNISIIKFDGTKSPMTFEDKYCTDIDVSNLSSGIYVLKGQNDEGHWISKRIVKAD